MTRRGVLTAAAGWLAFAALPGLAQPVELRANEGQVMEVDRVAGEIVIRHGYLPELDMAPMAMAFRVADASFLKKVRKGDFVKFKAGRVDGRFGILEIQRMKPEDRR